MTHIKLCGLSRVCDIEAANKLKPEYIGFVFSEKSKRYVSPQAARALKRSLAKDIKAAGVFVNATHEYILELIKNGVIDVIQLHGDEDENYIKTLRELTDKPIIKAFRIKDDDTIKEAQESTADYILLDSGAGTGTVFDWSIIQNIKRPYFLAGGLDHLNIENAIIELRPYAVDVSSGIETDGFKDKEKMASFVDAVRKAEKL